MVLYKVLGSLFVMMVCVEVVSMRCVRVVCTFLVLTLGVVFGGELVVLRGVLKVLCGVVMMVSDRVLVGHELLPARMVGSPKSAFLLRQHDGRMKA